MKSRLIISLLFLSLGLISDAAAAERACQFSGSATGVPKAVCKIPACPSGGDCTAPDIDKKSARLSFEEPLYRWVDGCPEDLGGASCWEAYFRARFELRATDNSGIKAIGVNLAIESGARREFKKFWVQNPLPSGGSYRGDLDIRAVVAPNTNLSVSVYELCAKDSRGNQRCILPLD